MRAGALEHQETPIRGEAAGIALAPAAVHDPLRTVIQVPHHDVDVDIVAAIGSVCEIPPVLGDAAHELAICGLHHEVGEPLGLGIEAVQLVTLVAARSHVQDQFATAGDVPAAHGLREIGDLADPTRGGPLVQLEGAGAVVRIQDGSVVGDVVDHGGRGAEIVPDVARHGSDGSCLPAAAPLLEGPRD